MKNHVEIAGYAAFGVGLCAAASLLSPGFTPDASPAVTTLSVAAFAVGLVCLTISAMWSRWPIAPAVARPQSEPETTPGPRGGA